MTIPDLFIGYKSLKFYSGVATWIITYVEMGAW
jgi:hypothetical protein